MPEKQIIITISREYGSGGRRISEILAERYGFPIYDRNILEQISIEKGAHPEVLSKYDEAPRNRLLSRTVKGYSNSPEENIAALQFDFLRERAQSGESFIALGRCSEFVLKEYRPVTIFILGDKSVRIERIMQVRDMDRQEAESAIKRHDRKRKSYHNYYSPQKWGSAKGYDLCVNSSRMGIERTAQLIHDYVNMRRGQ